MIWKSENESISLCFFAFDHCYPEFFFGLIKRALRKSGWKALKRKTDDPWLGIILSL